MASLTSTQHGANLNNILITLRKTSTLDMPSISTPTERQQYLDSLRDPPRAVKTSHFRSELIDSLPIRDPTKSPINVLSNDLLLCILDHLDAGASVCFGLTNKKHYAAHRRIHDVVMPMERLSWLIYPDGKFGPFAFRHVYLVSRGLYGFIAEWMLDGGWKWSKKRGKFVKEADWEKIESEPRRPIWKCPVARLQ